MPLLSVSTCHHIVAVPIHEDKLPEQVGVTQLSLESQAPDCSQECRSWSRSSTQLCPGAGTSAAVAYVQNFTYKNISIYIYTYVINIMYIHTHSDEQVDK